MTQFGKLVVENERRQDPLRAWSLLRHEPHPQIGWNQYALVMKHWKNHVCFHDEIDGVETGVPERWPIAPGMMCALRRTKRDPEERLSFLDDIDLTVGTWSLMPPRLQLRVSS